MVILLDVTWTYEVSVCDYLKFWIEDKRDRSDESLRCHIVICVLVAADD